MADDVSYKDYIDRYMEDGRADRARLQREIERAADTAAAAMPRAEFNDRHSALESRMGVVESIVASVTGQEKGSQATWAVIIAGISTLAALAAIIVAVFVH